MKAAFGQLSDYIIILLMQDNANILIAQKKVEQKRWLDQTDPAIIKMFNHEPKKRK